MLIIPKTFRNFAKHKNHKKENKMEIKILGPGCQKCQMLTKFVNEVVAENNFDATVKKVEDMNDIMNYGILATPGLVINEKVITSGRVPSKPDLKKYIEQFING